MREVHDAAVSPWRGLLKVAGVSKKFKTDYSRHANVDHTSSSKARYAKAKRGANLPIAGCSQNMFRKAESIAGPVA
jgi:hypothetical protein